jgi:PAS domain S-box-containing protein
MATAMQDNLAGRVLLVDDNPATLYSTARVLRAADFDVTEASTGQEALALALAGTDILMLDVNLPDIHGFEVCRLLREDPRTMRLPIIHLSATYVTESDKARGLNAGSDGYLTHPIDAPVLIATINAFLRARKAEEELKASEIRFKAVFDNALSGLLLLDRDLNLIEVNPALCRMMGRGRRELIGQPLFGYILPADDKKLTRVIYRIDHGKSWTEMSRLPRLDGSIMYLEFYVPARSDPHVVVVSDVSQRAEFENERQELFKSERAARAEAEHANRVKDEFLGNLAHELRTPLNSILLWTKALQQSPGDPQQMTRALDAIERNVMAQTQLISDLLDVSRITAGKLRLELCPTDLAAVTKAAVEVLTPVAAARKIELVSALDPQAGPVIGDAFRLQQIVWNLVSNALKFTPESGRIEVRLQGSDKEAVITVTDNGQGIKPELLPYLFERFRQGEQSRSSAHTGLGLGLSIVKHLAQLHGGSVSASSAGVGCGATFTVRLPIADELASAESMASPAPTGGHEPLAGLRILVVDDDAETCDVVARTLEHAGAATTTAGSTDEALGKLEQFAPDLLIADIGMPERDGYSLIREVRSLGYRPERLPAIALTALARPEDRSRSVLAGFQLHISKPAGGSELIAAVRSLKRPR